VQAFSGESMESLVLTLTAIHEWINEAGMFSVPVILKLPPHLDLAALDRVIAATSHLVSWYTCINTSPNQGLKDQTPIGKNKWGLSWALIFPEMIRTVKLVRQIAPPEMIIIASGGLWTGNTRKERFWTGYQAVKSGANFVSAYSSLAFLGPWVMYDIIAGAVTAMKEMEQSA
jgi:dihydroorotate dehydrogenase